VDYSRDVAANVEADLVAVLDAPDLLPAAWTLVAQVAEAARESCELSDPVDASTPTYHVILFNDEVHKAEDVRGALVPARVELVPPSVHAPPQLLSCAPLSRSRTRCYYMHHPQPPPPPPTPILGSATPTLPMYPLV
jgi:hypothetical protein